MTRSEELFETFCKQNSLEYQRIETAQVRRPDYLLKLDYQELVVEVKQLDPNAQERRLLRNPNEEWDDGLYHGIPGERIRSKIDSAIPQLKNLAGTSRPTMLLLYDNVKLWAGVLDSITMAVAMYGLETIMISSESAPEGGAKILARWHGASKRTTRCANTTLSAVGILDNTDANISIDVFHNFFARVPLQKTSLQSDYVRHYILEESPDDTFAKWKRFTV